MNIVLGRTFDSGSYPTVLAGTNASVGSAHLGPAGFLARLEQIVGVPPQPIDEPIRVAQYAKRLAHHDDGREFYSKSRRADAWRTAGKLLSLRDELFFAGWRGENVKDGGPRLRAFAGLESLGSDFPLARGAADRLARVIERLDLVPPHIDRLDLVDPAASFPKLWRDLFEALRKTGAQVREKASDESRGSGDLHLAQRASRGESPGKVKGDGSFVRLECKGLLEAAEITAAVLSSLLETNEPESIVLVRDGEQRGSLVLEKALRRFDIASTGLTVESSHRPATQILPLFLGLAWEPIDPDLLVQFLTLPSSPIPRGAREIFRRALNEAPGYGSRAWLCARQHVIEDIEEKDGRERASYTDRRLKEWLDDVPRTPSNREMPVAQALRFTRQVADWANGRAHAEDAEPFFFQAKAQAEVMARLLELHPRDSIGKAELGRMLFDVSRTGVSHELSTAAHGSFHRIEHPGSIFGPVPIVVWWHCVGAAAPVPPPRFWTGEEARALRQIGCILMSPAELLLENARAAHRPILNATQKVILVQPEQAFGEPQESHPVWNEIAMKIAATDAEQLTVTATAERLLDGTSWTVRTRKEPRQFLPGPKLAWKLPARHLEPRETESPTSLERLLGCPLRWVLHSRARLREPLIQVVQERQLLYGNLAHRIVGDYLRSFVGKELPSAGEARRAITGEFDRCVAAEAATLIKPGMDRERTSVRSTLQHAAGVLIDLLQHGDYRIESVEEEHTDSFPFGRIAGRTDLIVRRARDGMKAVIDLKWSGNRRKIEALEKGTALQLAAYAYLHRISDRWPRTAYFLFPSAQLFATNEKDFPGCTLVQGPDEKAVWDSALVSVQRVREALDQGRVDVALPGDPDEQPEGADEGIPIEAPCGYCSFQMFCRHP